MAGVTLLIPVGLYFWFIHRYGVNAIYYDQWNNVALLTHTRYVYESFSHTTVGALWSQHGEDRMFFPNLIVLAQGHLTNLNIVTELYLSAVLLVLAFALIILAHRQDMTHVRLVYYLPVAFLVFTLGQFENTLFGFQMWLYLVIAMLAAAIFLLNLRRSSWLLLIAAIVTAVIGSYSALDGLAIWPAGLVVLFWKHRPRPFILTWVVAAIATTALYFYHFNYSAATAGGGSSTYVLTHPKVAAEFFFFAIGDIMGTGLSQSPGASDPEVVALGVAIFLLAVVCLVLYGRRPRLSRSPVGPALICFGILLAVLVTIGRAHLGVWAASQSRYVTEDLFILAGCYLCLLERLPAHDEETVATSISTVAAAVRRSDPLLRVVRSEWRQGLLVALRGLAILLIAIEVVGGIEKGVPNGAATQRLYQRAALVAAHAEDAPNSLLESRSVPQPQSILERSSPRGSCQEGPSQFLRNERGLSSRTNEPPENVASATEYERCRPAAGAILQGSVDLVRGCPATTR